MLLELERNKIERKEKERLIKIEAKSLSDLGVMEKDFQDLLFESLERLFPEDELIMIQKSRPGKEEPDLMAIDKNGHLFIFEIKRWESKQENLLQVLRYGQLHGQQTYNELAERYKRHQPQLELKKAFRNTFSYELKEEDFNRKQVFVIITNGIDYKTREAIKYWRSTGLDLRPWIYRVYGKSKDDMQIEISPFRVEDDPFEDIPASYHVLNTNYKNDPKDHEDMLKNKKAAAYYHPWKYNIDRLSPGDIVFLYQSTKGIVAYGQASGNLKKKNYHDLLDEEHYMELNDFHKLDRPLSASEIKEITGINHVFMQTMFGLDNESGQKIKDHLEKEKRS